MAFVLGCLQDVRAQPSPTPPQIERAPEGVAVQAGDAVRVGAVVTGQAPLTFTWTSDAGFVARTESPTLVINNVQPSHAGVYALEVTNALGFARSQNFVVSVQTNPLPKLPWLWQRLPHSPLGTPDDQAFGDMVVDRNGNTVVVGSTRTSIHGEDWLIQAYGPDGRSLWTRTFNWGASSGNRAEAAAVDSSGNIYVTGTAWILKGSQGDQDYITMKLDPNGATLWEARFDGGRSASELATDLAVDSTGAVYVIGDGGVVKYSPDGKQLWYSAPAGWRILLSPDEQAVYVEEQHQTSILKLNTGGGTIWSKTVNKVENIAVDGAGNLYLCVTTNLNFSAGTGDILAAKLDRDGNTVWAAVYDTPQHGIEQAIGLAVCADGSVFVIGDSRSSVSSPSSAILLRYTQFGETAWTQLWSNPELDQFPYNVAVDLSGNAYLCRELGVLPNPSRGRQGILTKVRWDGAVLWSAPLSTSTNGATYFAKVMVDDTQRISVGGSTPAVRPGERTTRDTMLVLRFDQLTPRLFGAPASDANGFDGVAVGPPGKICDITASSDLWQWAPVAKVTNLNGVVAFREESIPLPGQKFYRAQNAR